MKLSLTEHEAKTIKKILSCVENVEIILFGSRVTGTAGKYSDLDICLKGKGLVDLLLIGDLREEFENSNLPFNVDILDYQRTSPEFQKIVDTQGINAKLILQDVV
jgi:uncharacterized protein